MGGTLFMYDIVYSDHAVPENGKLIDGEIHVRL